jgi:hypothetical protein
MATTSHATAGFTNGKSRTSSIILATREGCSELDPDTRPRAAWRTRHREVKRLSSVRAGPRVLENQTAGAERILHSRPLPGRTNGVRRTRTMCPVHEEKIVGHRQSDLLTGRAVQVLLAGGETPRKSGRHAGAGSRTVIPRMNRGFRRRQGYLARSKIAPRSDSRLRPRLSPGLLFSAVWNRVHQGKWI